MIGYASTMKVKEFMTKYGCGMQYSQERQLINLSGDCEILCYLITGLPKEVRFRTWGFIFRSRSGKLMAVVNGRRETSIRNVLKLVKEAKLEQELPKEDLEKELLIGNI